jgi:hypothetical protein
VRPLTDRAVRPYRARALHGLSLDEVREAIGAERFASGWDAGRMLTTDQAVIGAIVLAHHIGGCNLDKS